MNNIEPDLYTVDFESMISEVWLYVNPLTGKHAKSIKDGKKLAVFINERVGRKWEQGSETLKNMIGYAVTWDEMKLIADKETNTYYELFLDTN
jgi:hypothetical protein